VKRPHQITATILLLFSAFLIYESFRLRYYTSLGPGPGFFPLWVSILVGVLAGVMLYQATFGQSEPMPADFFADKVGYLRIAAVLLALSATVALLEPLGFRLTMLGFLLFLLMALGRVNPYVTVLVALLGSFGTYYVFWGWLRIPLPVGIFGL
jgi:putative tricarboxylic transport membrane protein